MTEIKRSIEISAPGDRVWDCIQPQNWTKLFNFVENVDGCNESKSGIGTKATILAGEEGSTAVRYNVEVIELEEESKIVYRRYGGPLGGKGEIQLRSLQNGTLLTRKGIYEDNLSEETIDLLSEGMEKDNKKIKKMAESG